MKKILITGGSSGLGLELAKVYGKNGYQIILVGRSTDKLEQAVNILNLLEVSAVRVYKCDISDPQAVKTLQEQVKKDHGQIDRLINCAGVGHFGRLEHLDYESIQVMTKVNFLGTVYMVQAFKALIRERVINIISTAGLRGKNEESVYCATKFAVRGFTESLQVEWENEEIDITAVYMGGMDTPFWNNSNHITDKSRLRSPEKVARTIYENEDGRSSIIID
ncbi:SDR family NAD(P)-dependent oxidoreductase [Fusibacter sp. JL216-2]|uniref:SDR family NAD(P)-dependent oxidoreductase n=1 Tax=Fusibacter sp. JL216-2 TaxID=3071453 RepID=UPI003D33C3C5